MYKIEKPKVDDLKAIKKLELEGGLGTWSEDDYRAELARADSLFFLIREEGNQEPFGFVLARLIMSSICLSDITDQSKDISNEIDIYNIVVAKNHRARSLGTKLINHLISVAGQNGVSRLLLEVRKSNTAAVNFYKKHAFRIDGERRNFYSDPSEDALLMSRLVPVEKF